MIYVLFSYREELDLMNENLHSASAVTVGRRRKNHGKASKVTGSHYSLEKSQKVSRKSHFSLPVSTSGLADFSVYPSSELEPGTVR